MVMEKNGRVIVQLYDKVNSKAPYEALSRFEGSRSSHCLKDFYGFFTTLNKIFRGARYDFKLYSLIENNNSVMASYYITGHPDPEFMDPVSRGKKIMVSGIDVFRLKRGKVVEYKEISHTAKTEPSPDIVKAKQAERRRIYSLTH